MNGKRAKVNNYNKSKNISNNNNNDNNTKITIVDDDFDISNLIKMALQKQGYDVFGFTDPLLALEHFKINHESCNIVISDLRMPGMNGFEFLQNIKLIKPTVKVLLMSAFNIDEDLEYFSHSLKPGIDGFIQKPVSIKYLIQMIKSYIIEN